MSRTDIDIAREIVDSLVILGGSDLRSLSDRELIDRINEMATKMPSAFQNVSVSADCARKMFIAFGKAAGKIELDAGYNA